MSLSRPDSTLLQSALLSARSKLAAEFELTDLEVIQIEESFQLLSIHSSDPDFSDEKWGVLELVDARRAILALGLPFNPTYTRLLITHPNQRVVTYKSFSILAATLLHRRNRDQRRKQAKESETQRSANMNIKAKYPSPEVKEYAPRMLEAFRLFTRSTSKGGQQTLVTLSTLKRVMRELQEDVDERWLKKMILYANNEDGSSDEAWMKGANMDEFAVAMERIGAFR